MDWTDKHRHLMQYIMSYRLFDKTQLQSVHEKIFGHEESLKNTLDKIDSMLPKLGLRLVQKICESDGVSYYVLIPLWYEDTVISLNHYSEPQLNMFKSIVHRLIDAGEVSVAECLNLRDDKLSLKDASDTLNSFVDAKYFLLLHDNVRMSALAISELEPYFKKYFSDNLKVCNLCKSELFYGSMCSCDEYYHQHCLSRYRNARGSENNCPSCSE